MEQSPPRTANSHSVSQEIPCLLYKPKVHYFVHNSRHGSLSWTRWIQSTPSPPISHRYIFILPSHLHLGLPSGLFPSCFLTEILYHITPMCATRSAHLILLGLITLTISGEATSYEAPHYAVFSGSIENCRY